MKPMALNKEKREYTEDKKITPDNSFEEYPLSQGQAALWFQYKLNPKSVAYNLAGAAAVSASTDLQHLRCAFQLIAERHSMLRTLFTEQHGMPVQHIFPS